MSCHCEHAHEHVSSSLVRSEQLTATDRTSCCTGQMLGVHDICLVHRWRAVRRCLVSIWVGRSWNCGAVILRPPILKVAKCCQLFIYIHVSLLVYEFNRLCSFQFHQANLRRRHRDWKGSGAATRYRQVMDGAKSAKNCVSFSTCLGLAACCRPGWSRIVVYGRRAGAGTGLLERA